MEPQVQYAKTSDEVDIAFASLGEGPPLVTLPLFAISHVQRLWAMFPNVFQSLTRTFRLIWYDSRGTGLSDRDAIDFSMEAMMRDLEAVIDRTGLQEFAVSTFWDAVPIALTYATTFPDRVSHLGSEEKDSSARDDCYERFGGDPSSDGLRNCSTSPPDACLAPLTPAQPRRTLPLY